MGHTQNEGDEPPPPLTSDMNTAKEKLHVVKIQWQDNCHKIG